MTHILNNLLYFGSGMLVGLFLGQAWALMKQKRNERGWYTHRVSLMVVLTLTFVAAVWTGATNVQLKKSQKCTEQAFTSLVDTLNQRTSLSTSLNLADAEQNKAFSRLMTAVLLKPPMPSEKLRNIFEDYKQKLDFYLALQDKQRDAQAKAPFPRNVDYRQCLRGQNG